MQKLNECLHPEQKTHITSANFAAYINLHADSEELHFTLTNDVLEKFRRYFFLSIKHVILLAETKIFQKNTLEVNKLNHMVCLVRPFLY